MAAQRAQEPMGGVISIAIVALWFHVGLAALEVLIAAFTPDPNLRFLSAVVGLAYTAVAIGLQRRRPVATVWGIVLSSLAYGIALGNRTAILSSQLLILVPLIVVATRPRGGDRREPGAPRKWPEPVWFPPPMDDPLLARLRPPRSDSD